MTSLVQKKNCIWVCTRAILLDKILLKIIILLLIILPFEQQKYYAKKTNSNIDVEAHCQVIKLITHKKHNYIGILSGSCADLPDIDHLTANAEFPIEPDTVITVMCDHPWFIFHGDEQITCVQDREFKYRVKEPSCTRGKPQSDGVSMEISSTRSINLWSTYLKFVIITHNQL